MANPGVTEEMYGAFNFLLEIEGITGDAAVIVGGVAAVAAQTGRVLAPARPARRFFAAPPGLSLEAARQRPQL